MNDDLIYWPERYGMVQDGTGWDFWDFFKTLITFYFIYSILRFYRRLIAYNLHF